MGVGVLFFNFGKYGTLLFCEENLQVQIIAFTRAT